jgi:hypothetical protein
VNPKQLKASYKNGVLEAKLKREEIAKPKGGPTKLQRRFEMNQQYAIYVRSAVTCAKDFESFFGGKRDEVGDS